MLSVYLYNNDPFFYKNIRFAFEAFFNWVENGRTKNGFNGQIKYNDVGLAGRC